MQKCHFFKCQSDWEFKLADGRILFLASDIDCAADARESVGCDVVRVCYDDSDHVDHLRQHRESYIANVDGFVRKCIDAKKKLNSEDVKEDANINWAEFLASAENELRTF